MPDYIRKATASADAGVNAILASAYAKFDPIPEEWEDLLAEGEGISAEDITADVDPRLRLLVDATELIALDVGRKMGVKPTPVVVVREGCLIVELLIAIPLFELISNDLLKLLEMTANSEDASPYEAAKVIGRLIGEIAALERLVKKGAAALHTLTSALIGSRNLKRPEARTAILGNLKRLHENLSAAQTKSRPWQERATFLKKAADQLARLSVVLTHDLDRQIVANYLKIATSTLTEASSRKAESHKAAESGNDVGGEGGYIAAYNAHRARVLELYRHISAADD